MAEFQWWLLIVGLVAGGALVAVVFMDGSRREADVLEDERRAEATWISQWLASEGRSVSSDDVEAILDAHRDYLALPPPDRLEPLEVVRTRQAGAVPAPAPTPATGVDAPPTSGDADADRAPDEVRHDGRGSSDQDLASA